VRRSHPLILGGGPAGSAAAITLGSDGAQPLIVERQRVIGNALCGGFLSWRTLQQLDRLGINTGELRGHAIDHVRIFAGKAMARARLPAAAVGLSRHRLDTIMLDHAAAAGATLEIATVRNVEGPSVVTDWGNIESDDIFLATGKYDVRGEARPKSGGDDPTLGLRVRIGPNPRLTALLGSSIELHMFDRGYAGLLLQEDGCANLCMAVRKSRLAEAGGKPGVLLAELAAANPALADRLAWLDGGSEPDAIASVPYGWRALDTRPGLFRIGDQAAVIPSLAGEGIGIAIASGVAAAKAWITGGGAAAPQYQQAFAARAKRPIAVARFLWERGEQPWSATFAVKALQFAPNLANLFAQATRIED
jgi:flavin-dependent dehydrogenase